MYSHNRNEFPVKRDAPQYRSSLRKSSASLPPLSAPKILDQVRERIRYLHFSRSTEESYVYWSRHFIRWSGMRHPRDMGKQEVEAFLTFLTVQRNISVSTHRVALSALLFLYHKVLGIDLPWLDSLPRPVRPCRLPEVLSADEVAAIFAHLTGHYATLARLLYGTGLRINEGLRLRVKDVDFNHRAIIVREGKGFKERVVMLPAALVKPLNTQLAHARAVWAADVAASRTGVEVPFALERK